MPLAAAELTVNEVAHAGIYPPTDLAVIDHIELDVSVAEAPTATGGRLSVLKDWTPATAALRRTATPTTRPPHLTRREITPRI